MSFSTLSPYGTWVDPGSFLLEVKVSCWCRWTYSLCPALRDRAYMVLPWPQKTVSILVRGMEEAKALWQERTLGISHCKQKQTS